MDKDRIIKLSQYFYSSDSAKHIPLRICITRGMDGFDLSKEEFIKLMTILSESINLKEDLISFINDH